MASKKAIEHFADHTKYHLAPHGFWKRFRDAVVINPNVSSGLPVASVNRYPQPGSRPEKYATPASQASDPAQNPYHKRDFRRAYPQVSTVSQPLLTSLLLQSPTLAALHAPEAAASSLSADPTLSQLPVPLPDKLPDLTEALQELSEKTKLFDGKNLPPVPPRVRKWTGMVPGEEVPRDKHAYFPMELFK
ncbi:NADH dehydrogenase [Dacryopinax primogenitus]|uniref:NADH dehydrogenase n=1 Tax=Dacryopinax primogenitus (strain DJM 731) TaxID=1858805 RepID=M5G6S3_DACPD|nr:NADH dehydrogenase [Dacryopinax primogenitus]EJU04404.1 NADH dehydrogenase [Dacryopinax primogenitus]